MKQHRIVIFRGLKTVLAAVLALGWGGCAGGGPTTTAGGGSVPSEIPLRSFGAVSDQGGSGIDTLSEDSQPQAGGVSAMPVETEDEQLTRAEGTLEPVCRQGSEIKFHSSAKLFRIHKKDGVEVSRVKQCYPGGLKSLFWDGHSCQAAEVPAEDCLLSLDITAEVVEGLKLYGVITVTSEGQGIDNDILQHLSPSDGSDTVMVPPPVGQQMMGKIPEGMQPLLMKAQCRPEEPHTIKIENGIVLSPLPNDLPECGSRDRMKLPIKGFL